MAGHGALLYFFIFSKFLFQYSGGFVYISEVNADTPSTDTVEYLELHNDQPFSVSLDNYYLVFYSGHTKPNPALAYDLIDLSGHCIGPNGYFLIGPTKVDPTPNLIPVKTSNIIQNGGSTGSDGIVLYYNTASGVYTNDMLITDDGIRDAIIYDRNQPSGTSGDAFLQHSSSINPPVVYEDDSYFAEDESISRCSWQALDQTTYKLTRPTPGAANVCGPSPVIPVTWPTPDASCDVAPPTTVQATTQEPTTTIQATTQEPTTTIQATTQEPTTTIQVTTHELTTTIQATTQEPTTTIQATTQEPTTTIQATTQEPTTTIQATTKEPTTTIQATTQEPTTTIQATAQEPTTEKPSTVAPSTAGTLCLPGLAARGTITTINYDVIKDRQLSDLPLSISTARSALGCVKKCLTIDDCRSAAFQKVPVSHASNCILYQGDTSGHSLQVEVGWNYYMLKC